MYLKSFTLSWNIFISNINQIVRYKTLDTLQDMGSSILSYRSKVPRGLLLCPLKKVKFVWWSQQQILIPTRGVTLTFLVSGLLFDLPCCFLSLFEKQTNGSCRSRWALQLLFQGSSRNFAQKKSCGGQKGRAPLTFLGKWCSCLPSFTTFFLSKITTTSLEQKL